MAKPDHLLDFQQGKAANAHRRMIRQRIGIREVSVQGRLKRRKNFLVNAQEQLFGASRGEHFVAEDRQSRMRDFVQAQGRFAHFAHTFAQSADVFRAIVSVQAESHLEFVDGFGRQAVIEDLVKAFEDVMIPFEAADAAFDRKARLHGLFEGT
jgi:hypothetical protein